MIESPQFSARSVRLNRPERLARRVAIDTRDRNEQVSPEKFFERHRLPARIERFYPTGKGWFKGMSTCVGAAGLPSQPANIPIDYLRLHLRQNILLKVAFLSYRCDPFPFLGSRAPVYGGDRLP